MIAPLAGLLVLAVFVWSGIAPADRTVWLMEVSPVILGVGALALCWKRFPFTPISAWWVAVFAAVICIGGHYTYAEVPFGFWLRDALGLERNPYDRIGHLLQGVVPALLAREMLLRCTDLRRGKALFWTCVSVAVAISAMYEILEWWSALVFDPEAGTAFLGSQGDEWDAQWDMALALAGAIAALLLFARRHDRQLAALGVATPD